tara:strand:- start:130 stop:294 length:165 start_codon:yes stop_codon:yes gene_type:complete
LIYNIGKLLMMMSDKQTPIERLHEDYRKKLKEKKESTPDEEWVKMQTYGGGAET